MLEGNIFIYLCSVLHILKVLFLFIRCFSKADFNISSTHNNKKKLYNYKQFI